MKQAPATRRSETTTHRRTNQRGMRRLYYTARWGRVRRLVLARDDGLCQECSRDGRVQTGNQIDHILPAEEYPELFWELSNLETLCRRCHTAKTRRGE